MARTRRRFLGGISTTLVVGGALLVAGPAPASAGGATAAPASGGTGGTEYGIVGARGRPVATRFSVAPRRVVTGARLPAIRLRIDEPGTPRVRARVVLTPVGGEGRAVRLDLGAVPTGRALAPQWPDGTTLVPGRYVARVHATDPAGRALERRRGASGRSALTVAPKPKPKPKPKPAPAPEPAPPVAPPLTPVTPSGAAGTFPVAGPVTYGDGFGADRGDHSHQGVDLLGAEGTPIVAPLAGTVRVTAYQASGAGEYVVLRAGTGAEFFFAHCLRNSTKVVVGQAVPEGAPLCAMGSTGRSSAMHLHFEIWPNGWRTGAKDSVPVDPVPQLRAWER